MESYRSKSALLWGHLKFTLQPSKHQDQKYINKSQWFKSLCYSSPWKLIQHKLPQLLDYLIIDNIKFIFETNYCKWMDILISSFIADVLYIVAAVSLVSFLVVFSFQYYQSNTNKIITKQYLHLRKNQKIHTRLWNV